MLQNIYSGLWKCGLSRVLKEKHQIMKSTIIILIIALLGSYGNPDPSIKITGKVINHYHGTSIKGVKIAIDGSNTYTSSDTNGDYSITVPNQHTVLVYSHPSYATKRVVVGSKRTINVRLQLQVIANELELKEAPAPEYVKSDKRMRSQVSGRQYSHPSGVNDMSYNPPVFNTEEYAYISENIFHKPVDKPLSTFSIDVDAASYSNVRRFLKQGQLPPKDAVRIEEFVNYFNYEYQEPNNEHPFTINTELSEAPWNQDHLLMHIGLQGRKIPMEHLPPSNLVFLIDVSGSMNSPNKLGLLKSAFKLLSNQLRPQDQVAMVVYAGAAGVVLPSTSGDQKQMLFGALNKLQAGGSTAGGEGIQLAYKIAREHFIDGGNNRIILATDGDFNVGPSSNAEMERLIERERENGVFLTVLGFGMGNYKDSKMEVLADKGNGNYAYIDDIMEAKKVLVNEFGGTLFTIAKDVKLQIEFNPAQVKAYRLIGYENRQLQAEDFNNDRKDAGELGSGHTVTALYEIIPVSKEGADQYTQDVDPLKYQQNQVVDKNVLSKELLTVKFRYKQPTGSSSKLLSRVVNSNAVRFSRSSDNFRWSAAVAAFGMLLRDSEFKGNASYAGVIELAQQAKGADKHGYRREFIELVRSVELLALN